MKNSPSCIQNVGNLPKIKALQGGIHIPLLEGNIKKQLLQPKGRAGLNSPPKSIKSFNNCKNNALGLLKKNRDGDYCDNPTKSLNILLGKFFPGHAALSKTDIQSIKDKTGLYIIIEGSKYDWLEYASGDTIHKDIFVTLNKKVINPTINSYLENQWFKNWENIKGHHQTKFWFSLPDPYLTFKLLNMFREHLGKCILFFTGHGWWKKHLKLTKLSNNEVSIMSTT